jgi:hypothetical protein
LIVPVPPLKVGLDIADVISEVPVKSVNVDGGIPGTFGYCTRPSCPPNSENPSACANIAGLPTPDQRL